MKYDIELIKKVVSEYNENPNKLFLSKKYKIPRGSIAYWLKADVVNKPLGLYSKEEIEYMETQEVLDRIYEKKDLYSFILGLYLGDGCISPNKKSFKLRIVQDNKYSNSINEIQTVLENFFEKKSTRTFSKGCTILSTFEKKLPKYFPQHGKGVKHSRKIELFDFQKQNIDYKNLMRGLFISDGSFYVALNKYERYNFTNKSLDIINIFRECLNHFNISHGFRVKPNNIYIVEVQKKSEVIKMKDLVGKKS